MFRRCTEQSLEASPQVGSFAEVGLRFGVVPTKEKDCRRSGSQSEGFSVACGDELELVGQHWAILVRFSFLGGRLFRVESKFSHFPHSID